MSYHGINRRRLHFDAVWEGKIMKRFVYLTAVAAAAMTGSMASAALVQFGSSTAWHATAVSGTGWNSDIDFDDSGWANAISVSPAFPERIWAAGTPATAYIRAEFDLSGDIISGLLTGGVDDDASIWINGVQVLNDRSGGANNFMADISKFLVSGRNLIAVQAINLGGPAAFHSALSIETVPAAPSVPEPATWAMMIGGFAMAGAALRRTRAASLSFG